MPDLRIAALIPAAGMSSRMKAFKPLLDLGGQTFIERAVRLFETAGVTDVVTVIGHRRGDLMPVLARTVCRWVFNPHYRDGMFTSVQQGARELHRSCDAFFVLPVDTPLVRPLTVRHLMEAYARRSPLICYPRFMDRRGHPPLIDSRLIDEMLTYRGGGGLRAFLARHGDRAETVPVADAYIGMGANTREDLEALRKALPRHTIPSPEECQVLLTHHFSVSPAIEGHSRAVAGVARRLGNALNDCGRSYDLDLLTAGGLLHDICKGQKGHADRAAVILREAGFPEVAGIVAEHMVLRPRGDDEIDEASLLYLADRMVQDDQVVSLDMRRSAMMEKYARNGPIRRRISERFQAAETILARIEAVVGRQVESILSEGR